jgi:hypothetical protein
MRERAQASVETVALIAAALAVAAVLLLAVVRLAPPLASALGQALAGIFASGEPTAPGLDGLERALLTAATSSDSDGPTLLDVRTHLRLRMDRSAADAIFAASLRPLVIRALEDQEMATGVGAIALVERTTEDEWLHSRFHPARLARAVDVAVGLSGTPGAVITLAKEAGLGADEPVDGIAPGRAAGDIVVKLEGIRDVTLRRRAGRGLRVIADELVKHRWEPRP